MGAPASSGCCVTSHTTTRTRAASDDHVRFLSRRTLRKPSGGGDITSLMAAMAAIRGVDKPAGAREQPTDLLMSRRSIGLSKSDERRWTNFGRMVMSPEATVVERCEFCSFVATGPLEKAREAFEAHECDRPKPTTTVRRRSGYLALAAAGASAD
jgi:hypothetical protein